MEIDLQLQHAMRYVETARDSIKQPLTAMMETMTMEMGKLAFLLSHSQSYLTGFESL
jgi:hypothetical protein